MRTELILGTLDPKFDAYLDEHMAEHSENLDPRLPNSIIVTQHAASFAELFNPLYLFGASRELLDDTEDRFTPIKHRHFIPYIPVVHDGKFALYARTPKGTEGQLHGKLSIGFGGHIEMAECAYFGATVNVDRHEYKKDSLDLPSTLVSSTLRELDEEFGIDQHNIVGYSETLDHDTYMERTYGTRLHTIITSRAVPVDCRHLALVYVVEVKDADVLEIEEQLNFLGWFTREELNEKYFDQLEMWSKALVACENLLNFPRLLV